VSEELQSLKNLQRCSLGVWGTTRWVEEGDTGGKECEEVHRTLEDFIGCSKNVEGF
jgi:hypothetical protein